MMLRSMEALWCVVLFAIVCGSVGCSTIQQRQPTVRGNHYDHGTSRVEVEYGTPNKFVDGVGWVLGIPEKIVLLDSRANNHHVSDATTNTLAEYLAVNELDDVKVRVNQYAPGDEWKRLHENKRVGGFWRYTVGSLKTLQYTLLPGRLFGDDGYNPYTNTIYVYSDIPALALEQGAYAKDVRERSAPGLYAVSQELPVIGLYHEARSKHETMNYVEALGTREEQREAHRILHPQMGAEVGEHLGQVVPEGGTVLKLTGAAIGHVVGRVKARGIASPEDNVEVAPPIDNPVGSGTMER